MKATLAVVQRMLLGEAGARGRDSDLQLRLGCWGKVTEESMPFVLQLCRLHDFCAYRSLHYNIALLALSPDKQGSSENDGRSDAYDR